MKLREVLASAIRSYNEVMMPYVEIYGRPRNNDLMLPNHFILLNKYDLVNYKKLYRDLGFIPKIRKIHDVDVDRIKHITGLDVKHVINNTNGFNEIDVRQVEYCLVFENEHEVYKLSLDNPHKLLPRIGNYKNSTIKFMNAIIDSKTPFDNFYIEKVSSIEFSPWNDFYKYKIFRNGKIYGGILRTEEWWNEHIENNLDSDPIELAGINTFDNEVIIVTDKNITAIQITYPNEDGMEISKADNIEFDIVLHNQNKLEDVLISRLMV